MKLDRRFLLRGMFQGSAAAMMVPFLDCFLDSKGQALAATGQKVPTRFNTFFFGCGLTDRSGCQRPPARIMKCPSS